MRKYFLAPADHLSIDVPGQRLAVIEQALAVEGDAVRQEQPGRKGP